MIDQVLLVEGKVDNEGGDPKVLVDRAVQLSLDNIKADAPAIEEPRRTTPSRPAQAPAAAPENSSDTPRSNRSTTQPEMPQARSTRDPGKEMDAPSSYARDAGSDDSLEDDGIPEPPPDDGWALDITPADMDEWEHFLPQPPAAIHEQRQDYQPAGQNRSSPAPAPLAASAPSEPIAQHKLPPDPRPETPRSTGKLVSGIAPVSAMPGAPAAEAERRGAAYIPVLPSSLLIKNTDDLAAVRVEEPPRMITITLRPSGDRERDVRRLRIMHGMLVSCPGEDHFAFQVLEKGRLYQLEFPNNTTGISPDLVSKLLKMVGNENLHIEPIHIQ